MGDIADMMIEGELCQGCGTYLGDGGGFPVFCNSCQPRPKAVKQEKVACPHCQRKVKRIGLHNHIRDTHGCIATTTRTEQVRKP